jgi:hypothetical protein
MPLRLAALSGAMRAARMPRQMGKCGDRAEQENEDIDFHDGDLFHTSHDNNPRAGGFRRRRKTPERLTPGNLSARRGAIMTPRDDHDFLTSKDDAGCAKPFSISFLRSFPRDFALASRSFRSCG